VGFAHDLHTVLVVNWINQGPGQARANAWHKLGLLPTRLQAALWHAEDQRAKKDRICQSLKAFKQRSQEGLIQQERKENSSCPNLSCLGQVLPLPALLHEGPQRNGSIRDKKRRLCEYITAPDKHQHYLNEDELG